MEYGFNINSENRADLWGDYVGWDSRKSRESGFLTNQLLSHECRDVIDVALGDGVDAISLIEDGFNVKANEVDDAFRAKAIGNAALKGFDIQPTSHGWPNLSDSYSESTFDAVICIGHSIGCELDPRARIVALRQFRRVLRNKGILVVDERNFSCVSAAQERIYVYTGRDRVSIEISMVSPKVRKVHYTHKLTGRDAYYVVWDFKKGELLGELSSAGFPPEDTKIFSDYKEGHREDAQFYQYVCTSRRNECVT